MPCKDITDTLKILLDNDDRLVKYSLSKRTCGGAVGQKELIGDWLKGKTARELLGTGAADILDAVKPTEDVEEYLVLKHFFAVQIGVQIMLGLESGGKDDCCRVDTIHYGPKGMVLVAQLDVNGLTEQIKSCGGCTSCGSAESPQFSV